MNKALRSGLMLAIILGLSLFLRVFLWDFVPARLTVDEMSIGYNAYSILETGKDEWGRKFPLVFEAFGDFKLPLYIYLSIPFIAGMGLTMTSVKMVSLISGLVFVISVYVISNQLFSKKRIAWIAGLLAGISPWAVHLSRQGLESNLALALFSAGLAVFLCSLSNKKKKWLMIVSGILLGLTFYAYVAYRMMVTLVVGLMVLYFWKNNKEIMRKFLVGFVISILPLLPSIFSDSGIARAKHVSIFTDPGIVSSVNENRSFCYLVNPKLTTVCRVLFNKPQEILDRFVKNYVSFLSPEFLFLTGDINEYLGSPGYGEYFWFMLVFLLVGVFEWVKKRDSKYKFILGVGLVAPVAGAIAGSAQMVRGSMLLLPLTLILGYGVNVVIEKVKKLKGSFVCFSVGLMAMGFFVMVYYVNYFVIYPTKYDSAAYQMPLQVTEYLKENEGEFDLVYINDYFSDAHMAVAYFLKLNPTWYQQNVVRPGGDNFGFSHPVSMGKYVFGAEDFDEIFCDNLDVNGVYIASQAYRGYFDEEFRNYSGVHTQVKIITFSGMKEYMKKKNIDILDKCSSISLD